MVAGRRARQELWRGHRRHGRAGVRAGLVLGLAAAFMTCGLTNCSGCGLKGLVALGSAAVLVGLDKKSGFLTLPSSSIT